MNNIIKDTSKYISILNNKLNRDKNSSLNDILNSFSQLSKDYPEYTENIEVNKYTSPDFYKCTYEEQQDFINEQMQFVECLVTNSIRINKGMVWGWHEVFNLLHDKEYAKTEKNNRKALFPTSYNTRPIGEPAFDMWNGLQVIDLDIKNAELAEKLKHVIFKELNQYHWFLGCCVSASGKSLHVWTKIQSIGDNHEHKKIEFYCNFRHKYSYVYIVLLKYAPVYGYTKEDIVKFMDMAMGKPQQASYISSDNTAYVNTNFIDTRLDVNFEQAYSTGISSIDWISHPDLKEIFSKLNWFSNNSSDSSIEISDIENLPSRDVSKSGGKKHYKHNKRWQLANTLTSIYGSSKALDILVDICKDTPYSELAGDVKTASIHDKPISIWAVKELNKYHGFNIKIKSPENREDLNKIETIIKNSDDGIDPIRILNDNVKKTKLHLNSNQYLSDIKDDIIKNLNHITLLEAGAGYGKTEMIKSLNAKTLLILPFTSTIKAKVEASEVTKDWLSFYGNKRPTLDDILGDYSISMTIDKFSRLNVYELDQANFKYIVIDESHLLFTSSYRGVMSPCIQRLANCKAKVIMMTGTPTGEMLFFPNIKHIKVEKDDTREKKFTIHFVPRTIEKTYELSLAIAKDIVDGKKILFPTNKGNLFFEQMTGIIQQIITEKFKNPKIVNSFYYKKSNYGDEYMDSINVDKSIGNNDIIFCTDYLSVGVDICDRYRFSVYFDEMRIPQDIEQFANRLRNNNLYINLFLETEDNAGLPIDYTHVYKLDLSFDDKDLLYARDLIQTCNDMLWRNKEESKYNPVISTIISKNPYLKYDENDCLYYIDETTYKLKIFEDRYSDYSKQLPVMQDMMKYYGYNVSSVNFTNRVPDSQIEQIETYFKDCRNKRYNYNTTQTLMFLDHINDSNIDMYRDLLRGSYEIFKDDKFEIDRNENNLYCTDIEILEKNIPIVLGLYKFYDCDTIKDIFRYCIESKQNKINYSKLNRIRKFVNIEYNRKRKRLDFPIIHFMNSARDFATNNPTVTSKEIIEWLAKYAAKYADSVKDVVVEDIKYLEDIFEMIKELWSVVIIQSRPKNGNISISPFELLWTRKADINDIYGGSQYTKEFFLNELIDNIEEKENDEEEIGELEKTSKLKLIDVEKDLQNVIHSTFDYKIYSIEDNSNDRFLKKQYNTNSMRDTIFGDTSYNTNETSYMDEIKEQNLFTE